MQTIETLAVKLIGDVGDFQQKMASAAQSVAAVGAKMQEVGAGMQAAGAKWSLFVTAPIVAMGKAALTSAGDFEQSMNVIEQITGATTEQMAALSNQALKLGKDTVFSAGEAAKAQLALAKAGMSTQQIMDSTTGVVALAAAADMDLADAAKISSDALNAFRLPASDAGKIADLLAAAANNSTASVADMGKALQMSSAVMSQYGFTAAETVTILTQMANAGIRNSDAGTALKTAFMHLAAPTDVAKNVMEQYGISVYDSTGAMRDAQSIIEQFSTNLAPLTEATRNQALATIFGTDGLRVMNILMADGVEKHVALAAAVTEAGAAQEVADARMKGLSGAILYFQGTLDSMMISTAIPWLNQLADLVRGTADWIAKFGELDPAIQKTVVTLVALAAAVGPVLIYSGMLVSAIGSITQALAGMTAFLLANPIVALAALAAALVAFGIAWDNDWMGIRDKTQVAVEYVQGLFDRMVAYVQANLPDWMAKLAEWGAAAWQWIVDMTPVALAKLGEWTVALIGWVIAKLPDWIATLLRWATAAVAWIGDSLPKAITALGEWVRSFVGWGNSTGHSQLVAMGVKFAQALVDWVVVELIPKIGPELLKFNAALRDALWNIAKSIGQAAIDIGIGIVQGIIDGIASMWNNLVNSVKNLAGAGVDAAKDELEQHSPSRKGLAIGANFGKSIGMGARSALGNLQLDVSAGLRGALADIEPRYAAVGNAATQPGPVTISMSFVVGSGADAGMVAGAARGGTLAALRQVGYA